MATTPNPGSKDAAQQGCTCPVLDNNYGRGIYFPGQTEPSYWTNEDCPLHGVKK